MESFHLQPSLMYLNNTRYNNNNNNVCEEIIMGEKMVKKEKWVKHYSSNHEILLVGEGDFSFSLSLAVAFGSATNIFATSLDSYGSLINTYKKATINLVQLRVLGATVLHEVDARKMKDHPLLKCRKFDSIVYNFPHAGFYGSEDNPDMINMHQGLVHDFFSNARCLLRHNGQIHITHKTKPPYSSWNLEVLARSNSLLLKECVPFDIKDYSFYENKRGHGSAIDEPFDWRDSYTFKFIIEPLSPCICSYNHSSSYFNQPSSHFNQPSSHFNQPRVKFIVKAVVRHYPRAAGYAGVLVDENHSTQAILTKPLPHMDVDVAELLAVKSALHMFEKSHLCRTNVALDIQSSSSLAVSWIRSHFGNPRELYADLQEIAMAYNRIQNRIQNPIEFCYSNRAYGDEHEHKVHQLAVEAMDMPETYWPRDNIGI